MNECLNGAYFVENMSLQIKALKEEKVSLYDKVKRLQSEVNHARNELCLKCGSYHDAHLGACDDCRFRFGGEWSVDLDE